MTVYVRHLGENGLRKDTGPNRKPTRTIVNKLRQTGEKESQSAECLLKRNWMKSMLSLNILFENLPDLHRIPGFR
jgi:hypothetical protein